MATTSFSGLQIAMSRSCIPSAQRITDAGAMVLGGKSKVGSWNKLASVCHVSPVQPFHRGFASVSSKSVKVVTKAMSDSSAQSPVSGLPLDLKGFVHFLSCKCYVFICICLIDSLTTV